MQDSVQPTHPVPGPRPKKKSGMPVWLIVTIVIVPTAIIAFGALLLILFSDVQSEEVVLVWDLRTPIVERSKVDAVQELFGESSMDLVAAREVLQEASTDPRVRGLILRVGGGPNTAWADRGDPFAGQALCRGGEAGHQRS